ADIGRRLGVESMGVGNRGVLLPPRPVVPGGVVLRRLPVITGWVGGSRRRDEAEEGAIAPGPASRPLAAALARAESRPGQQVGGCGGTDRGGGRARPRSGAGRT